MFAPIMEAGTKKILGTLAVVAAIGGGFYLARRGKKILAGAKMNFALLGFRIHKINLQEVQFAVKLRCYNPTNAAITLAINQAVANYKGSAIAYSTPDIKGTVIGAGKMQEPEILFQVPYLNLVGKGLALSSFSNIGQLKADMAFTLTLTINGETLTTTQSLGDENMNGLASLGIVSGSRNTLNGKRFNYLIGQAGGQEVFIKTGNVLETVESCINIIASHYREVEKLAKALRGSSLKDTCRNIFNFSYNYLQYHKDGEGTEQLRTPARSWLDGQVKYKQKGNTPSGIDCDDYCIFVGSLLKCLGIPFKVRIAKYDGKKNFQHIYVFVPDTGDSEDEIVIDPVLSRFDYQKPYSAEKSDFNMSPLHMVAGIHGVDGLTGTTGLGLPIYALSGVGFAGGGLAAGDYDEMMAIVSGIDFEGAINGLGDPGEAALRYLTRTRDFLLKSQENKNKMAHIQDPGQFISMLDQAIKYWDTPERDKVLTKLEDIEKKLIEKGLIKYDIDTIQGFAEVEGLGGFWSSIKRIGKKIGSGIKKAAKAVGTGIKKAAQAVGKAAKVLAKFIVRFNPLSIAIRNGLLAALRMNMFGLAKKLQYAYLPDEMASKYDIDLARLKDLKERHNRVRKLFSGLQGKPKNLRKAILKGAKQNSPDFSLSGAGDMVARLQRLEALGELSGLGDIGALGAAVSIAAASGVLAKISSWLKPVKNLFNKIRGKAAVKKVEKLTAQGKEVSDKLLQRAGEFKAQQAKLKELFTPRPPNKQAYIAKSMAPPSAGSSQAVQPTFTKAAPVVKTSINNLQQPLPLPGKNKMGAGAKIGIGLGIAALIGTGAYFMLHGKGKGGRPKHGPHKEKKALGGISLH